MNRKYLFAAGALLAAANHAAFAGEKFEEEAHTPFIQQTVTREYEPTQRAFNQDVQSRADELKSQPGGGPAWINRAEQPKETTTVTNTLKGDVAGFGGSVSHQAPPSTRSADEAALKQVGDQN